MKKVELIQECFEKLRKKGVPESALATLAWTNDDFESLRSAFGNSSVEYYKALVDNRVSLEGRSVTQPTVPEGTDPAPAKKIFIPDEAAFKATLAKFEKTLQTPAPAPAPKPQLTSAQAYGALLNAHIAAGMSKGAAHEQIAKEHPELHAEFLQAINQRTDAKPEKKPLSSFEGLVSAFMETNKCSRGDAIEAVAHSHPEAHKAYIQAVQP